MPADGPDRSGHQRQALRLVVDAAGRTGGGGRDDGAVGGRHRVPLGVAAGLLHRLEDARGGPAHRHGIGVLGRQRLDLGQHLQARAELVRIDRSHARKGTGCFSSPSGAPRKHRQATGLCAPTRLEQTVQQSWNPLRGKQFRSAKRHKPGSTATRPAMSTPSRTKRPLSPLLRERTMKRDGGAVETLPRHEEADCVRTNNDYRGPALVPGRRYRPGPR